MGALIWLAIFAGRQYKVSHQLLEAYAHKEALSTAFEGYKNQMATLPSGDGSKQSPLVTLCDNTLAAIAEHPGKIYEQTHEDDSPLSSALQAVTSAVKARLPPRFPSALRRVRAFP